MKPNGRIVRDICVGSASAQPNEIDQGHMQHSKEDILQHIAYIYLKTNATVQAYCRISLFPKQLAERGAASGDAQGLIGPRARTHRTRLK